jgi:hypothetical protein
MKQIATCLITFWLTCQRIVITAPPPKWSIGRSRYQFSKEADFNMATPADVIYQLIKSNESKFPLPAPYVTLNVGTFNAASGTFSGLTTKVVTDPEPIEHEPNQQPRNPAPTFRGAEWVSITIDSHWRRTTTSVPAPIVPLAPIMLQFAIANASSAWSVVVNGVTVSAPSTQATVSVSIWDAAMVTWSVQAGAKSYKDTLKIQRPKGAVGFGVGAFTIPVLPVSIIYAPPADSLSKSAATYIQGQTLGTTVTTSFGTDTSKTVPDAQTEYGRLGDFQAGLDTLSQFLGVLVGANAADTAAYGAASKIVGDISSQLGKFTSNVQTGISDLNESQLTVTQTTTNTLSTIANAGGPGSGDLVHFYKNVRMAWSFLNGQFRLTPLGFVETVFPAGGILTNLGSLGISAADAQLLLDLDPFAAGGPQAALPADRFTFQETWEYGFGTVIAQQVSVTRDTKDTTTEKNYTTTTNEWDPGPIFKLLGFGEKDQTTVTLSNATGTDVSSVITLNANLVSGPQDHFVVNIWYDNLFGTFAFQQSPLSSSARFQGAGATPGQHVTLTAGGKVFRTVADKSGKFGFWAPTIPAGAAKLAIGSQPAKTVAVAPK